MDDRLYQVEQQKQQALNNSNSMYQGLLNDNQNLYNEQKENANQQEIIQNGILDKQLANQRTEIEKQKEIANQNYQTETKRARNDYTSFINPYGVNAETQASQGLANSGLSETTKLGGWNTYQNRLASANKVMQDAFTQYDKDLNDAILNNDVQKAQNALNRLQMQIQFSQNFYNNKSTLTQNQLSNNQSLDSDYFNRYQTVYGNIEQEKARAEAIRQWEAEMQEKQRQYNENMAWQKEQQRIQQEQWQKEYELSKKNLVSSSRSSSNSNSTAPILKNTSNQDNDEQNNQNAQQQSSGSSFAASGSLFGNLLAGMGNNNSQSLNASYTPKLYGSSYDWYNKNFSSSMTDKELARAIENGLSLGKLSQNDVNQIYKAYGLK